jgi:KDO2-lipid IV(A) lauroyltransferase
MLGTLANVMLIREKKIAHENLRIAFPDLGSDAHEEIVSSMFENLGTDLGDAAHAMTSGKFEPLVIAEADLRALESARAAGRGVLFVSAHLGPWEQVAASIVMAGFPLTTVARESYDPRLTRMYDRLRGRHGVRSIYRSDTNAGLRAMRCLKRGELLGVVMDLKSRVPSIDAPFLGKMSETAIGPARLALRASSRVVVATAAPNGNDGLAITVTAIETSDLSSGADHERTLTARINDELSRRIRALPQRWVWMHRRF